MQPEINVFGLSIKTFGLFFALNFVAWGALVSRRLRELGKPVDWAYEMVAAALVGGLSARAATGCCRTTSPSAWAACSAAAA